MKKDSGSETVAPAVAIQSLARASNLLDAVALHPEGISLAELARAVDLHSSTAHHLVRSMVALDWLRQDAGTKRYTIGPKLFSFGSAMLNEVERINYTKPLLVELADRLLGASQIAVLAAGGAIVIGKYEGFGRFSIEQRTHPANELYHRPLQIAMQDALPEDTLDTFIGVEEQVDKLPQTTFEAIRARVDQIRSSGLYVDNGEFDPKLIRLSAPIFSHRGEAIAAVGISIPVWRLEANAVNDIVPVLREAASTLSVRLDRIGG